ncbi:MAG: EpsG family protein [Sulfurovum sp.]
MYWLLYIIPASMALFMARRQQYNPVAFLLIGFIFIIIIGFRHKVGGDWYNYLNMYNDMFGVMFRDIFDSGDPAHKFFSWLMYRWDWGVYGSNIIYATIFMVGLIQFSRRQTYPWLSIAVAVPYLILVVVMGYSRQGVAIGLFLLGVTYLDRGRFIIYILFIITATLFHKTAILLLPLGVFLYGKGKFLRIIMIIPIAYGSWDLLFAEEQEALWVNYVEAQMMSDGAKIRVAMNLIPSLLLFKYRNEWKRSYNDYTFWFWIALGSVVNVFLVNFASTAVDRVALYFIPIQLVVFARLPYLARKEIAPSSTKLFIVLGYGLVLFVWLNFATHSKYWLPYQNIIVGG